MEAQSLAADEPEQVCMIGWSDASLANRPDFSSAGGHIVGLVRQQSLESGFGRVNPVAWKSGKLQRVARSLLSAEPQSLRTRSRSSSSPGWNGAR